MQKNLSINVFGCLGKQRLNLTTKQRYVRNSLPLRQLPCSLRDENGKRELRDGPRHRDDVLRVLRRQVAEHRAVDAV